VLFKRFVRFVTGVLIQKSRRTKKLIWCIRSLAASKTHPECATLFGPLSAARKEGWYLKKSSKEIKLQTLFTLA